MRMRTCREAGSERGANGQKNDQEADQRHGAFLMRTPSQKQAKLKGAALRRARCGIVTGTATQSDNFVTCSFIAQRYFKLMMLVSPSRLLMRIRQIFLLCVVVGLLAPQVVHAGMARMLEERSTQDVCAAMADHDHSGCTVSADESYRPHHDTDAACKDMTCFCAMPFSVQQTAQNKTMMLVSVTPAHHVTKCGISPSMLRKPPKHV
jgi:hypothetical protein